MPRIDHVQRRPTHEELQDYHEEHSDYLRHRTRECVSMRSMRQTNITQPPDRNSNVRKIIVTVSYHTYYLIV